MMRLLGISEADPGEGAKWLVSKVHQEEKWKSMEPCTFCRRVWKEAAVLGPHWPRLAMASAAFVLVVMILRFGYQIYSISSPISKHR